jgi:uncharacterized protein
VTFHDVNLPNDRIREFCVRHRIRRLAPFGSILRNDFRPDSDVDMLVEFEPGTRVGLIRLAGIENELSILLGRKVDLNTPGSFKPETRSRILSQAEVQFAAG